MDATAWRDILRSLGCLYEFNPDKLDYHFVGTSGKHLGGYVCLDPLLCDQQIVRRAVDELAKVFGIGGELYDPKAWPEVVVVPSVGEIALLHPLTTSLVHKVLGFTVNGVWADKVQPYANGATRYKICRPGFAAQVQGKRPLIVVDFFNSGHTVNQLVRQVKRCGGHAAETSVGALVYNEATRPSAAKLGVRGFYGMVPFRYPVWSAQRCASKGPCSRGVPIVVDDALGHGSVFCAEHDWPDGRCVRLLTN